MKRLPVLAILALCVLAARVAPADAALLIHETRASGQFSVTNPDDFITLWAAAEAVAPTPGYGNSTVSNWAGGLVQNQTQNPGGSNSNIFYHFEAQYSISAAQAGTWHFRLGGDFGGGGAAYVDGVLLDFNNFDHWWGNDLNNTGNMLVGSVVLGEGNHIIEVFGSEGCCDGHSGLYYKIGGDANVTEGFTAFTSTGLPNPVETAATPEPATAGLGLLSLAGLALRRRLA